MLTLEIGVFLAVIAIGLIGFALGVSVGKARATRPAPKLQPRPLKRHEMNVPSRSPRYDHHDGGRW